MAANNIRDIAHEIRAKFISEFGDDISIDEIEAIIDTQFALIPHAITNNKIIEFPYMGKFATYDKKNIRKKGIFNSKSKFSIANQ